MTLYKRLGAISLYTEIQHCDIFSTNKYWLIKLSNKYFEPFVQSQLQSLDEITKLYNQRIFKFPAFMVYNEEDQADFKQQNRIKNSDRTYGKKIKDQAMQLKRQRDQKSVILIHRNHLYPLYQILGQTDNIGVQISQDSINYFHNKCASLKQNRIQLLCLCLEAVIKSCQQFQSQEQKYPHKNSNKSKIHQINNKLFFIGNNGKIYYLHFPHYLQDTVNKNHNYQLNNYKIAELQQLKDAMIKYLLHEVNNINDNNSHKYIEECQLITTFANKLRTCLSIANLQEQINYFANIYQTMQANKENKNKPENYKNCHEKRVFHRNKTGQKRNISRISLKNKQNNMGNQLSIPNKFNYNMDNSLTISSASNNKMKPFKLKNNQNTLLNTNNSDFGYDIKLKKYQSKSQHHANNNNNKCSSISSKTEIHKNKDGSKTSKSLHSSMNLRNLKYLNNQKKSMKVSSSSHRATNSLKMKINFRNQNIKQNIYKDTARLNKNSQNQTSFGQTTLYQKTMRFKQTKYTPQIQTATCEGNWAHQKLMDTLITNDQFKQMKYKPQIQNKQSNKMIEIQNTLSIVTDSFAKIPIVQQQNGYKQIDSSKLSAMTPPSSEKQQNKQIQIKKFQFLDIDTLSAFKKQIPQVGISKSQNNQDNQKQSSNNQNYELIQRKSNKNFVSAKQITKKNNNKNNQEFDLEQIQVINLVDNKPMNISIHKEVKGNKDLSLITNNTKNTKHNKSPPKIQKQIQNKKNVIKNKETESQFNIFKTKLAKYDYIGETVINTPKYISQLQQTVFWQLPAFLLYKQFYLKRSETLQLIKISHSPGISESFKNQIHQDNQSAKTTLVSLLKAARKKVKKFVDEQQLKEITKYLNLDYSSDWHKFLSTVIISYLKTLSELFNFKSQEVSNQQKNSEKIDYSFLLTHQIQIIDAYLICKNKYFDVTQRLNINISDTKSEKTLEYLIKRRNDLLKFADFS